MKKKVLLFIAFIGTLMGSAWAQIDSVRWGGGERDTNRRGFALGADRDSNEYVIASPFDNWFLGVGGGAQTLIGNERDAEARWNAVTPRVFLELGKWVLPDLAVSLRANGYTMMGQSKQPLCPYVDMTQTDMLNEHGYYPYQMYGWSFVGLVSFDWTNFLRGYEDGGLRRLHFVTTLGLGGAWETAEVINPKRNDPELEGYMDRSWNRELLFHGGMTFDYKVGPRFNLALNLDWEFARGSYDWSPEGGANNIRMDHLPNITLAAKWNILKHVRKYHVQSGTSAIAPVYDHFRPARTYYDSLVNYQNQIQDVLDSLEDAGNKDKDLIDSLNNENDKLQDKINSLVDEDGNPINPFSRLKDMGLPSTVVFYKIDRSYLDYNAKRALEIFAEKVIKSGNKDAVYMVIGAADKGTGTVKRNIELSIARCNVVYNYLVDECGIDPKQLEKHMLGGITEYGAEGSRMTMVITANDEVNALIEKYEKK